MAGWRDSLALSFKPGQLQVQPQEEGEEVFRFLHAVGGADGGVEGGMGVAEAVGAGGFESAIEVAQGPTVGLHDLPAQGVQLMRRTIAVAKRLMHQPQASRASRTRL